MSISLAYDGDVATITMDDPARRNALGHAALSALSDAFADLTRRRARAVILRAGPGNKVWCAGFDIDNLVPGHDPLADDGPLKALFRAVAACRAPVIAMLNGSAWGGGTDLALRCDITIADPSCTLAFTPARLGLPYDPEGLLNVSLRAGMAVAMEMFATADAIPAERALALGLLNHVVPKTEIDTFASAMAARIAANAPLAVASAKQQLRAINATMPVPAGTMQAIEAARQAALHSADFIEGLAAFRAKRRPGFEGV